MVKTQKTVGPSTANWKSLGVRVPAELAKVFADSSRKK